MEQKIIIPRDGIIVPLPDGNGNLPAAGKPLTLDSYWYQRHFDGDVTFEDLPPAEEPAVADAAAPAAAPKTRSK